MTSISPKRSIVQISACVAVDNDGNESSHTMVLASDGTLWMLFWSETANQWAYIRIPDLPQGQVKPGCRA